MQGYGTCSRRLRSAKLLALWYCEPWIGWMNGRTHPKGDHFIDGSGGLVNAHTGIEF
jgi:hypothetical protein